jgi:hypothetical protein
MISSSFLRQDHTPVHINYFVRISSMSEGIALTEFVTEVTINNIKGGVGTRYCNSIISPNYNRVVSLHVLCLAIRYAIFFSPTVDHNSMAYIGGVMMNLFVVSLFFMLWLLTWIYS